VDNIRICAIVPNKYQQSELSKLSPFLKNTQKSRHLTQSVVVGVTRHHENITNIYSSAIYSSIWLE
jgi:hypothetical protein